MNLSSNKLSSLPPSLKKSRRSLSRLLLQGNLLEGLPGEALAELSKLVELDVGDNRLRFIPEGVC